MKLGFVGAAAAAALVVVSASAQAQSFVGTWRAQVSMTGTGGYGMIINMEDVFQPDGKFSSLTNSRYTNGPAAGSQIGAMQSTGTYTINAAQGILTLHTIHHEETQKGILVPPEENDHFQFTSPTILNVQSLLGGPIITFYKVQ